MFTSMVVVGLLAGDPVPVLRHHGKPKTKPPAASENKPIDEKPKLDPSAYDYYPENMGIKLYDVKDAKGRFGYELNALGWPSYTWEGLVPVRDLNRKTTGHCYFCVTIDKYKWAWDGPGCQLQARLPGPIWYDGGNFVVKRRDYELMRANLNPFRSEYNNETMRTICLVADFSKVSWMIHYNDFEIRFGNLLVELPAESLAALRVMAEASLDFAEGREEKGRERLDEQIRLQDNPPMESDSQVESRPASLSIGTPQTSR